MPMIYGEADKAFLRLQEEIIKRSDDHSIFAWPARSDEPGLLGQSPDAFATCSGVRSVTVRKGRSAYRLTNRGLSIKLTATPFATDTYLVRLDCVDDSLHNRNGTLAEVRLGMSLRRLDEDDQYVRVPHNNDTFVQPKTAVMCDEDGWQKLREGRPVERIDISVPQDYRSNAPQAKSDRMYGFRIPSPELFEHSRSGKDRFEVSTHHWDAENSIMYIDPGEYGFVGSLDIEAQGKKIRLFKLGFDFEFNPVCFVAMSGGLVESNPIMDRTGHFNSGPDSQRAQWTKEERAQFLSIHARTPFDQLAWSEVHGRDAHELRSHSGLWAWRGDRIDGLDVSLGGLADIRIVRADFKGKLIWDFHVSGMEGSSVGIFRDAFN